MIRDLFILILSKAIFMDHSEVNYFTIFNEASDGILVLNVSGGIAAVNNSFCKLSGFKHSELLKLNINDIFDIDAKQKALLTSKKKYFKEDLKLLKKEGNPLAVELSVSLFQENQFIAFCKKSAGHRAVQDNSDIKETLFESAFESSAMGMVLISAKGQFLRVNRQIVEMLGYSKEELLRSTFSDITHPEDVGIGKSFLEETVSGLRTSSTFEKRYIHKNGSVVWVKITSTAVASKGKVEYLIAQIQNITHTVESGIKYSTLLEKALIGIYLQVNDRFTYTNPRLSEILGYSKEELHDLSITSIIYEEDLALAQSWKQKRLSGLGDEIRYELRLVRKDGQVIWVEVCSSTISLSGGNAVMGNVIDITKRKSSQIELRKMNFKITERVKELKGLYKCSELANDEHKSIEEVLKELVDIIPATYQYSDIATARILYEDKVFESKSFESSKWCQKALIRTDKGEQILGQIEVFYIEEKPTMYEGPFLEEERFLIDSMADILSAAVIRRTAVALIKEQAETFQAIIENAKESIYLLDPKYEMLQFNKTAKQRLGQRGIQLEIGMDFREIIFPNTREPFESMFQDSLKGNYRDEEILGKDDEGAEKWMQVKTSPVFRPNGELQGVSVLVEQIDDRKKAEIEIKESEEKFRSIVEQSLVGVYIIQNEQLVYANPGFQKIFGFTEEELIGKVAFEDIVHPDDVALIRKNYKTRIEKKSVPNQYTFRAFKKDGNMLHLEVIVSYIPYRNRPAVIGTLVDITDRVLEEMRINKAAIQAQESERFQIGMELHDNVQQILVGTGMFLDNVLKRIDDPVAATKIINNIKGYNADAITELRRLSHQLAPSVDMETSLEQKIFRLVESLGIGEEIEVFVDVANFKVNPDDEVQLTFYRVLQEQMTNILKYAKASNIQITVSQNNDRLVLSVKDNGVGFDTESKKSGIGLENIKRRAHALNGTMKIESSPGQGCALLFEVPFG